jgi:hypothetical protein
MLNSVDLLFLNYTFKLMIIQDEVYVFLNKKLVPFALWPPEVYTYFKNEMKSGSKILGKMKITDKETEHEFVRHFCLKNFRNYQFVSDNQLLKLIHTE